MSPATGPVTDRPRRVVVVGYGMAGARLADEIRARDPAGRRVALTVLGREPHHAYNRVLLSDVIAGALDLDAVRMHDPRWAARHGIDLRLGVDVAAVDRPAHRLLLADGTTVDYDDLVLATGAGTRWPAVPGLRDDTGTPAPGVFGLRDLADCAGILAHARPGRPVAVLGGGVLGLETARGLAARGADVTVVHHRAALMERQLDGPCATLLAARFATFGVTCRLDAAVIGYRPGDGLYLAGGDRVPADLLVVCAGAVPRATLANRSGLAVDTGVLVDDRLRTSDPRVHALGDCAQHPDGQVSGQVRPAWRQAEVLADLLTGANLHARYRPATEAVRLKARDVELLTVGDVRTDVFAADAEVLRFEDPVRGRYAKLVLRDDRVTGAIMFGLPDAAATVTQLHDSGMPAPSDRLALLLGRALPAAQPADDPGDLPGSAVLCRCNTVTKAQLVRAWQTGARDPAGLATATRAGTGCGGCADRVRGLLDWLAAAEPALAAPAASPSR